MDERQQSKVSSQDGDMEMSSSSGQGDLLWQVLSRVIKDTSTNHSRGRGSSQGPKHDFYIVLAAMPLLRSRRRALREATYVA